MADSSLYLNYPGLKYLNKMSVDWNRDSSYYLGYEGLKYIGGRNYNFNQQEKKFLSLDGLECMLFSRMFPVLEEYEHYQEEQQYAKDSSIRIELDYSTGEINLICEKDNISLAIDENGECGSIEKNGMLNIMVVKDGGITGGYFINENGEIVKNG